MFTRLSHIVCLITITCIVYKVPTHGQDRVPGADRAAEAQALVEQLDSAKFAERHSAVRQLRNLGVDAIPALEKAVLNGSTEVADQALGILQFQLNGDFLDLSSEARSALERIAAKEGHPKARLAASILSPKKKDDDNSRKRTVPRPRIAPQIMNQQIKVQMRSVNGKRDITVTENGNRFRFSDGENGKIKVERPDDQGGVKKSEYKDEDALKQADKEAYDKYKRYSGKGGFGGGIRIQMNGGGVFPPGFPQIPGQLQPPLPLQLELQPRRLVPIQPKQPIQPIQPKKEAPVPETDLIEV